MFDHNSNITIIYITTNTGAPYTNRLKPPLIGIHLRGGDKHGENIAMWGDAVARTMANTTLGMEKLLQRHGQAVVGGTCFLVGDGSVHVEEVTADARRLLQCDVVNQV